MSKKTRSKVVQFKNKKVQELVNNLGIKVDIYDYFNDDHTSNPSILMYAGAWYDMKEDRIFINPATMVNEKNLTMSILHEIGHWTGHKSRLNRKTLYAKKRRGTEEVCAQACFFYLARELKLEMNEMTLTQNYIESMKKNWPKLNTREGFDYGLQAANYVLELAKMKEGKA